jgi:CheY-like chemotaxis protein
MQPKKILLVDDEPLVLRSMQKTLTRIGYEVETASDCTAGLATFEEAMWAGAPFDMVLVDLNMPGFDGAEASGAGLDLLSKLIERKPDLPVIVLSAYDEVGKAKEAVTRGASGYCVKGREKSLIDQIQAIFKENE